MSEERLQEIKDSVEFQKQILIAHNMEILCVDEEQELIEEVERLENIIKEVREYIEKHIAIFKSGNMLVDMNVDELLDILDKEVN